MADVTWPSTFPQAPLLEGFKETPPDNLLRTEMDQGPAKARRRSTSAVRPITWPTVMTTSQVSAFEDFYTNTIKGGALRFNITHPRTNATVEARIISIEPYRVLSHNRSLITIEMEFLS